MSHPLSTQGAISGRRTSAPRWRALSVLQGRRVYLALCLLSTCLLVACGPKDEDGDQYPSTTDCDDSDPAIHPDQDDGCDGRDNNCDGAVDETFMRGWYADADGDGYGAALVSVMACAQPAGYVASDRDCNDTALDVSPDQVERCNEQDDDCDGVVDDGFFAPFWYPDRDGDGFGDDRIGQQRCEAYEGGVAVRGDCDDEVASVHPGADDPDDDVDQDCGGTAAADPHLGYGSGSLPSLADAVASAKAGQTVWVGPGTYVGDSLEPVDGVAIRSSHFAALTTLLPAPEGPLPGDIFDLRHHQTLATLLDGFTLKATVKSASSALVRLIPASLTLTHCVLTSADDISTSEGVLRVDGGSMLLRGCVVKHNRSVMPYIDFSSLHMENCRFEDNRDSYSAGALNLREGSDATITACSFIRNSHRDENFGGGAIRLESDSRLTVTDTEFLDNESDGFGGAIYSGGQLTMKRCLLRGNSASCGGALMQSFGSADLEETVVVGNRSVNCGAVYMFEADVALHHVTIVGNVGNEAGGMILNSNNEFHMQLTDSVLAYNTPGNLEAYETATSQLELARTVLFAPVGSSHNLENTTGIIDIDPGFMDYTPDGDASNDDLHLAVDSPLRDAGDPLAVDLMGTRADIGAHGSLAAADRYDADGDQDGLPDGWERQQGLNPAENDADVDTDGDLLRNRQELLLHTSPQRWDTDRDQHSDGVEHTAASDPLDITSRPGSADPVPLRVPEDLGSVQAAVDALRWKGEVRLAEGSFEGGIEINGKEVTLSGPGADVTELNGNDTMTLLTRGAVLTLSDVTIRYQVDGIELWESEGFLRDVQVVGEGDEEGAVGIAFRRSTGDIQRCTIRGGAYGVVLNTADVQVNRCEIRDSSTHGLGILYAQSSLIDVQVRDIAGVGVGISQSAVSFVRLLVEHTQLEALDVFDSTLQVMGGIFQYDGVNGYNGYPVFSLWSVNGVIAHSALVSRPLGSWGVIDTYNSSVQFERSVIAYNGGDIFYAKDDELARENLPSVTACALFEPEQFYSYDAVVPINDSNLVGVEPAFLTYQDANGDGCTPYDVDCLPADLHLQRSSPLVNAGTGDVDVDGSTSDIGPYGGPEGGGWDLDQDGIPAYFWPGTYVDAPASVDVSAYDPDDLNPAVP